MTDCCSGRGRLRSPSTWSSILCADKLGQRPWRPSAVTGRWVLHSAVGFGNVQVHDRGISLPLSS